MSKIPVTEEQIKRYLQRRARLRTEPSIVEIERLGLPVTKSGRVLRGKRLAEYYRKRFNGPS